MPATEPGASNAPTTTTALDYFTTEVQDILAAAEDIAKELHLDFVETEHVLAAMLQSTDAKVLEALRKAKVDIEQLQVYLKNYLQPSAVETDTAPSYSVEVKQVLTLTVEEAQKALLEQAGPMQLLFGLVRSQESKAAHALAKYQVTMNSLAPLMVAEPKPATVQAAKTAADEQSSGEQKPAETPAGETNAPATGTANEQEGEAEEKDSKSKSGLLSNFTVASTDILSAAAKIAQNRRLSFTEPEHILMALAQSSDGSAAKLFEKEKVDILNLINNLTAKLESGSRDVSALTPAFSPRTRRLLESAHDEAKALGMIGIDPIHILLALLRVQDGAVAEVLRDSTLDYDKVKREAPSYASADSTMANLASAGKTSVLEKFGEDLTEKARQNKLDVVVGRQHEIEECVSILSRRLKNNPLILGEAGVGKTALVEGIAQLIVGPECPEALRNKKVISLNLTAIVSGASHRGEFEERMEGIIKEVKNSDGEIILFIDEIHNILGGGSGDGTMSAANILKPALSRGELRMIGATTLTEFKKSLEKDPALQRRFQKVIVDPPTVDVTSNILKGLKPQYENYHKVKLEDKTLEQAAFLSDRYIQDRFLPDKAVDLVDQASAEKNLPSLSLPQDISDMDKKIAELAKEVETLKMLGAETRVKKKQRELDEAHHHIEDLRKQLAEHEGNKQDPTVTEDDIMRVVSKMTGIPVSHLRESEAEKLMHMEDRIHERVIGQEEAIKLISEAVRRGKAGLKNPNQPIGSFIFLGPTGVGKTELAKTAAEFLFGSEQALIRFDMSEFQEKHAVARLIGAPPGYVGYDEGGQLTNAVRSRPYSIILFDEIEKAHPDIYDILLQLLDDGRLTDSQGRTVDFKNTIVICTSNIGARDIQIKLGELVAPEAMEIKDDEQEAAGNEEQDNNDTKAEEAGDAKSDEQGEKPKAKDGEPAAEGEQKADAKEAEDGAVSPFPDPELPKFAEKPKGMKGGVMTDEAIADLQKKKAEDEDTTQAEASREDKKDKQKAINKRFETTAKTTSPFPDDSVEESAEEAEVENKESQAQKKDGDEAAAKSEDQAEGDKQEAKADNEAKGTGAVEEAKDKEEIQKEMDEEHRVKVLKELKEVIMTDLQKFMRPEMVNRFDEIVIFEPLTLEQVKLIVSLVLSGTQERLAEQEIYLEIEDDVKEVLAKRGFDPMFGARPLKRVVKREIDNELSTLIIKGEIKHQDVVKATLDPEEEIKFEVQERKAEAAEGEQSADTAENPTEQAAEPAQQAEGAAAPADGQAPADPATTATPAAPAAVQVDAATATPAAPAPAGQVDPAAQAQPAPVAQAAATGEAAAPAQNRAPANPAPASAAPAAAQSTPATPVQPAEAVPGLRADENPNFVSEEPPRDGAALEDNNQVNFAEENQPDKKSLE